MNNFFRGAHFRKVRHNALVSKNIVPEVATTSFSNFKPMTLTQYVSRTNEIFKMGNLTALEIITFDCRSSE